MEQAKRVAAEAAAREVLVPLLQQKPPVAQGRWVFGIGSGSTIVHLVEALHNASRSIPSCSPFVCIPTSFQSRLLLLDHQLPVGDLESFPRLHVAIDGADEIDPQLNCIKGGGACHTQEKLVAQNADRFVLIADAQKRSPRLGTVWTRGVPLEVLAMAYQPVRRHLLERLGAQRVVLRMGAPAKAGPCLTDNGHWVVDAHFGPIEDVEGLERQLKRIAGIVETGLFVGMAEKVFYGHEDGYVFTKSSSSCFTRFFYRSIDPSPANKLQRVRRTDWKLCVNEKEESSSPNHRSQLLN